MLGSCYILHLWKFWVLVFFCEIDQAFGALLDLSLIIVNLGKGVVKAW
jgi:hypothetical protein